MNKNTAFPLENLPFDPAEKAIKASQEAEATRSASLAQQDLDKRLKSMTYEQIEKLASDLM